MWKNLRPWRKASGFTLQEVAERLGVTHSSILRYEKGAVKPSPEILTALAELYGCTPAELEVPSGKRQEGKRVHDAILLAKSLPGEVADRWLEIERLLAPEAAKKEEEQP
jgi:transcriptional regulator with XRE-family HTH domain